MKYTVVIYTPIAPVDVPYIYYDDEKQSSVINQEDVQKLIEYCFKTHTTLYIQHYPFYLIELGV